MQENGSGQSEKGQRRQPGRVGFDAVMPNPKLKLLEQVREVLRLRHYSIRTERCGQSSADFQSAVSQNCILLRVRTLEAVEGIRCSADYKSAIPQIENLRSFVTGPAPPGNESMN